MKNIRSFLESGDLRSIAKVNELVAMIRTQTDFDALMVYLFSEDRLLVMRAADAVEKITVRHPEFLKAHKQQLLKLCRQAEHIELKWHLALLLPRLPITKKELNFVWELLSEWVLDKKESRIVRVNALQGITDLLPSLPERHQDYDQVIQLLKQEKVASINARIRRLRRRSE